jgi:hypothetical protein
LTREPIISEPPDEILEPGPSQTLALAPPTEVLEPDPDLNTRLAAAAAKRRDERRQETFFDEAGQVVLRGTVSAAEGQVFTTKSEDLTFIATRYRIKRQQSWKKELPGEVEVWALGGQAPPTKGSEEPPREESYSQEVYFSVGQEVLLTLREAPLYAGDKPRLRVLGGSSGALVAGTEGDTKALELVAATLDQKFKRY